MSTPGDVYLRELRAQLREIKDPMRRLVACRKAIDRHADAARTLRDTRDALIYAGIDLYSQPGRAPGRWRGVGDWRAAALRATGLPNGMLQKIETRRARCPEGGYWRTEGRHGRLRRLPAATADPDPAVHWAVVKDTARRADVHLNAAEDLGAHIRVPALLELMVEEPSNLNLEEPSGLTLKRLEQIRADGRAAGTLPPVPARAKTAAR